MSFLTIVQYISGIVVILGFFSMCFKPIRERVLGIKAIKDGQKSLLRKDMLSTYYRNRERRIIRQYEYENFVYEYEAYKALGGNSFIEKIYSEVKEYEIIT